MQKTPADGETFHKPVILHLPPSISIRGCKDPKPVSLLLRVISIQNIIQISVLVPTEDEKQVLCLVRLSPMTNGDFVDYKKAALVAELSPAPENNSMLKP